jgi:hypothetical protein
MYIDDLFNNWINLLIGVEDLFWTIWLTRNDVVMINVGRKFLCRSYSWELVGSDNGRN